MIKKQILLKLEFENHKLVFNVPYEYAKDRDIAEAIIKRAFWSIDKLSGKRANNKLNSYWIEIGLINKIK